MIITARIWLLLLFVTFVPTQVALAQSSNDSDTLRGLLTPTPPQTNSIRPLDVSEIQSDMEQLLETTQQLRQQREANREATPANRNENRSNKTDSPLDNTPVWNRPSPPFGSPAAQDSYHGQGNSKPLETTRSVDEIRERIRMLQRLRSRARPSTVPTASPSVEPPALPASPSLSSVTAETKDTGVPVSQSPVEPSLVEIQENLQTGESTAPVPQSPVKPSIVARRMMDRPVNPLALAESLYRTGNFQSSLTALRSVDLNGMSPSDRTWIDLLTALCQRRLGQGADAEAMFREIANDKSVDYPTQAAKWWLAHTEKTNRNQPAMKTLNAEISQLLLRSQDYVQR